MKESIKYLAAAKRIVAKESKFCCSALTQVQQPPFSFRSWFRPDGQDDIAIWYGMPGNQQNQLTRSLALLFMAEIAKEGEQK